MSTTEHGPAPRRRRAKSPEDRKTANMKFRTRDGLRDKIEAAASRSGRTASEEVETRLHNSFFLEPLHQLIFGNGEDARKFVTNVMTAIKTIQDYENPRGHRLGNQDWIGSEHTRVAIRQAVMAIIDYAAPDAARPADLEEPVEKQSGYTRDLRHMEDFGREFGLLLSGQLPRLENDLMRQNVAEH